MPRARRASGRIVRRGERFGAKKSGVWLGTFDSESEAQAAIDEYVSHGRTRSRETVGDFAARWLRDYPRTGMGGGPAKLSTIRNYEDRVRQIRKAGPVAVGPRLVKLADQHLARVDRATARAFSIAHPSLRAAVRTMFQDALGDELILTNPFAGLRLPASKGRADLVPLVPEEVTILADGALDIYAPRDPEEEERGFAHEMRAMILTLAYTGVRLGELLGLEWRDLSLTGGELRVSRRVWRGDTDTPKSGKARDIIVPDVALEALRGLPRGTGGPMFRTVTGRRYTQTSFTPYWKLLRLRFEGKLPEERREELATARGGGSLQVHELRHFCASWMLDQGAALEDVADQLGHADTQLLERLYGHPNKKLSRERLRRTLRADEVRQLRAVDGEADVG